MRGRMVGEQAAIIEQEDSTVLQRLTQCHPKSHLTLSSLFVTYHMYTDYAGGADTIFQIISSGHEDRL